MASINPFYRFEDAPEVPSMGEGAVRVSEILGYCYGDLSSLVFTGQNIGSAYSLIKSTTDYYFQNFEVQFLIKKKTNPLVSSGIHLVEFLVYDEALQSLYPTTGINIVLEVNTDLVTGQFIGCFGAVPANYDYGNPLYEGEKLAHDALVVNYETGAAVFPSWYSFDTLTGVATSYIARFSDCEYDASLGRVVRVPADTKPRGSAIRKTGIQQTNEGKYILAFFNQLITAAVNGASYNDLSVIRNSFIAPAGYILNYFFEVSPSERQQINVYKPSGEGYAIIIRDDNGIRFQRFFSPLITSLYDIIDNTDGNDPLPYPPNDDITYGYVWYDLEQYQFADACSIPVESYQMPIKSGDALSYNIEPDSANILTDTSVSVGLFDSNYNFVQKIGEAIIETHQCCTPYNATYSATVEQWEAIIDYWNGYVDDPATHKIGVIWLDSNNPTFKREFWYDLTNEVNYVDLASIFESFTDTQNIFLVTSNETTTEVSYSPLGYDCTNSEGLNCYIQLSQIPTFLIQGWPMSITGGFTDVDNVQHHASVNIPAINYGCYRFGLYRFGVDIEGIQTSWSSGTGTLGLNLCLAILDDTGSVRWLITIPKDLPNFAYVGLWLRDNIPFGEFYFDGLTYYFTYTVYPYISMLNWTMEIGEYDFSTGNFTPTFTVDDQTSVTSPYEENINEIYSFSNLLNLDNSDCFSTIIDFWSEEGSLAEGFEYFNNWKQRIRLGINGGGKKPVITESIYRQSNGVHKRPQNKQDLSVDLHTDFIDFETQCALVDATRHPYFVWNNQSLFVNGDIEVATIQDFTTQSSFEDLAQVKFSALVQGFQPKNSTCINC